MKGVASSLLLRSVCALQKKHGMRPHSPRKGQRPRISCLAAAKGALRAAAKAAASIASERGVIAADVKLRG
jgi:hypothetical protein